MEQFDWSECYNHMVQKMIHLLSITKPFLHPPNYFLTTVGGHDCERIIVQTSNHRVKDTLLYMYMQSLHVHFRGVLLY